MYNTRTDIHTHKHANRKYNKNWCHARQAGGREGESPVRWRIEWDKTNIIGINKIRPKARRDASFQWLMGIRYWCSFINTTSKSWKFQIFYWTRANERSILSFLGTWTKKKDKKFWNGTKNKVRKTEVLCVGKEL